LIILDTNVLSELMKAEPAKVVSKWVAAQSPTSLFTTTVNQAEILYGVALLPEGSRRNALEAACAGLFEEDFAGRVLSFDGPAAYAYAAITVARRRLGRPIAQLDAQIAALARSRGAAVATRNVTDFDACGVALINPCER